MFSFSNKVQLNYLYQKDGETKSSLFDIGYILHDCKGELKITTGNKIGFLNTSVDEVRLNNSLQKIKLIQTDDEKAEGKYSIYIEPSNKVLSFLSGIDYSINIGDTPYSYYYDNITLQTNGIVNTLQEIKSKLKKRILYNERTTYYDIDDGGARKNIFFIENINVVSCNIYSITHLFKSLLLNSDSNIVADTYTNKKNILDKNNYNEIVEIRVPQEFINNGILSSGTKTTLYNIDKYSHYFWVKRPFEGLAFFYITIKNTSDNSTKNYTLYLKYNGNLLNTLDLTEISENVTSDFLESFKENVNLNLLHYTSYLNIKAPKEQLSLNTDITKWTDIIKLHNTPKQNCVFGNIIYNNLDGQFTKTIVTDNHMKKYEYEDVDTNILQFKYMDSSSNQAGRKYVRIFKIDGIEDTSFNISDVYTDTDVSYVSFWFGNQNIEAQTSKLEIYNEGSYVITVEMYDKILEENGNRIYMKFTDTSTKNDSGEYEFIILPDTTIVSLNGVYFNVHPFYGPIDPADVTKIDIYLYPEYENDLLHVFEVKQYNGLESVDILFEDSQIQLKMDILEIDELQNRNIVYKKKDLIENLRYFELFNIDILLNYYQYAVNDINRHYVQLVQYNIEKVKNNKNQTIQPDDLNFTKKNSKISDDMHLYVHFDKYDLNTLFDQTNNTDGILEIIMLYSSLTFNINGIQYICFQDTELNSMGQNQKVLLKFVKKDSQDGQINKYLINEIATKKYYSTILFMKEHHYKQMISFKFRNYVYLYKFPFIMNENNEKEEQDNLQVEYNKVLYIKYDDPEKKNNPTLNFLVNNNIITPRLSSTIYFHVRGNLKIEQINDPIILVSTETDIYDRIFGNNHIVEIENKDTHTYNGFFKCTGLHKNANIKIDNLHVELNSKYMGKGEGLIVAKNSSFTKMIGCSSYSPYIQKYGGGLVGSYASNCDVSFCYSNAKIHQGGGGIFGRGAKSCSVYGSYSIGEIIMGGGIFGNDASDCFVGKSYTTGQIHAASGGIFGNYARDSSANDAFSTSEQIYPLSGSVFGNYAVRCISLRGTIPLDGSKNIIDNKYHTLKFDTSVQPETMTIVKQFGAFHTDCSENIFNYSVFKDENNNDPDDVDHQCKVCLYHVFKNASHSYMDNNDKGDGYEYNIWYVPDTFHISSHIQHIGTLLKNTLRNYRLHSFPFANPLLHSEVLKLVKTNNMRTDTIHGKQLILYENIDITNTSFKYTGVDTSIEDNQKNALFEDTADTNVYITCFLNVKYDSLTFVLPDGYIVVGDSGNASILQMGGDPEHIRNYIQPIILSIIQVDDKKRIMRMKSGIDIINKETFDKENYEDAYKYLNNSGVQRITNTKKLYKNGRLQLYLNHCYFIFNPYFYIFDGGKHNIDFIGIEQVNGLFYNTFNYNTDTIHEICHVKNLKITNGKTKEGGGFIVRSNSKYIKVSECTTTGEIEEEGGGIFGKNCSNCQVINSYTSGKIGYGGGGIFGAESVNCTANTCYSSGEIVQGGGGITGMESRGNHLTMCFANGLIGPFGGGLIGAYAYSPYIVDRCYTTGDISYSAGGFIGAYTDYENFKEVGNIDNIPYKDYSAIEESVISYSYVSGKLYDYSSYFYGAGSFYKLDSTFKYVFTTTNDLLNTNSNNNYDNNQFATANTHVYNTIQSFFLDENNDNEYNNPYGNNSFKPVDEPEMDPMLYDTLLNQFGNNGFMKDTFGTQSYVLLKSFHENIVLTDNINVKVWKNYYHYNDSPILFYEFALINNNIDTFAPVFLVSELVSESFAENTYIYTVKLPNYHVVDENSITTSRAYSLEQLRNPNVNNPYGDLYIDYTEEETIKKYYLPDTHTIILNNYDVVNKENVIYTNNKTPYHFVYPSWIYSEIFNDNLLNNGPTAKSIYSIRFDSTDVVLNLNVKNIHGYTYDTNSSVLNNLNMNNPKDNERYFIGVFYKEECIFYLPVYRKNDIFIKLKYTIPIRLNNNKLRFILYDSNTLQLIPIYISAIQRRFKNRGLSSSEKKKFIKEGWNKKIILDKEYTGTDEEGIYYDNEKIVNLKNYPGYFETDEFDVWFKVYHKYIYSQDENEGGRGNTSLIKLHYNTNYYAKNRRGELTEPHLRYEVNDVRLYYSKEKLTIQDIENNFKDKDSHLKNDVLLNNDPLLSSTSEMEKYLNELRNDFIKYE